jgi:hypothetical protein
VAQQLCRCNHAGRTFGQRLVRRRVRQLRPQVR